MQKSCRGKHDKPRSTHGLWHWVGARRLATRCPADGTPASPLFTRLRGGLHWPCSPANGFKPFAHVLQMSGRASMGCQPTGTRKRGPPGALPRLRERRPGVDPKVPWVSRATWLRHSAEMRDPSLQLTPLQWAKVQTSLHADAGEPNSSLSAESDDRLPTPGPYSQTLDSVPRGE